MASLSNARVALWRTRHGMSSLRGTPSIKTRRPLERSLASLNVNGLPLREKSTATLPSPPPTSLYKPLTSLYKPPLTMSSMNHQFTQVSPISSPQVREFSSQGGGGGGMQMPPWINPQAAKPGHYLEQVSLNCTS
jgi:hypothetical protein